MGHLTGDTVEYPIGDTKGHQRTSRWGRYGAPKGIPLGALRDIPWGALWDIPLGTPWSTPLGTLRGTKGHPVGDTMEYPIGDTTGHQMTSRWGRYGVSVDALWETPWDIPLGTPKDIPVGALWGTKGHPVGVTTGYPTGTLWDIPLRTPRAIPCWMASHPITTRLWGSLIGNPIEPRDTPWRTPWDRAAPSSGPLWDVGTGERPFGDAV